MTTVSQLNAIKAQVDSQKAAIDSGRQSVASRLEAKRAVPSWRKDMTEVDGLANQVGHSAYLSERMSAQSRKLAREAAKVQAGGSSIVSVPVLDAQTNGRKTIPPRPTGSRRI